MVPWQAARSIVIWRGERAVRSRRKWESIVLAATKQSRRARIPQVSEPAGLVAVIARIEAAALALVLHEDAQEPLAGLALPRAGDVLLIVGPEGGVAPDELSAFEAAGAVAVRLGPHALPQTIRVGSAAAK